MGKGGVDIISSNTDASISKYLAGFHGLCVDF